MTQTTPLHRLFTALCMTGLIAVGLVASPSQADAFCGFYVGGADAKLFNNATMVVMMREGKRTVLSMQNNYQGPPSNFAMVVPVPVVLQKENVKTLPQDVFDRVDKMASPRLVEYWEQDPCVREPLFEFDDMMPGMAEKSMSAPMAPEESGVVVEAQFEVGEYEIVILSAKDSGGLDTWLRTNQYNIPDGAEPVLQPYVEGGMYFFVAKVNADKVKFGPNNQATLSPLRFHYDSETFSLPVRLGLLNANGPQDLIVHVLARNQRYEVANFKNVTIPTNIEVADEVRTRFGEFYAALFDQTAEKNPGAVITEYSWDASTCDPCPGPNLSPQDFTLLGANTLQNTSPYGFVLTRLHARYTKDELSQDLVFKAAPPIAGGREVHNANKELEHGSSPAGRNNFQGRYIIRHPWEGPITCFNPKRGIWGGPPNGGHNRPIAAQDTAFAKRGSIQLPEIVRTDIPEIDVRAGLPSLDPAAQSGGCAGCTLTPIPKTTPLFALGLLGILGIWLRRRSKK